MINAQNKSTAKHINIGIAAAHGGFKMKELLVKMLSQAKYEVIDFGDSELKNDDDYQDL